MYWESALMVLAKQGLITLKANAGARASVLDITANPKKLKFVELEAAQLARALDDLDAGAVNSSYAVAAGLSPQGDSLALEVFRCTAERLGRALANAVAITSPEAVFFFGGLAQAGELLLEPTRRYLEENLLPVYRGNVKVLPSGIPAQNAAILGASALIWNE